MKKLLFLLIITVATAVNAQNSNLMVAPGYINEFGFLDPLPTPIITGITGAPNQSGNPYDAYDGDPAEYASNIITKPNGEINFFIVDGFIYDKEGNFIAALEVNGGEVAKGTSEIMIIPFPNDCERFYIVSTTPPPVPGSFEKVPYLFILNMSLPNVYYSVPNSTNCEYFGALEPVYFYGNNADYYQSIQSVAGESGIEFYPLNAPAGNKISGVVMGCTQQRPDGSRLAFITSGRAAFCFHISVNGFQAVSVIDLPNYALNPVSIRSELEVTELSNGNYRIAVPYFSQTISSSTFQSLFTAELTSSGSLIVGTEQVFHTQYYTPNVSLSGRFRGIEFSEDGNKMYVTQTTNPLEPNSLKFFDFLNPTPDLVPITLPAAIGQSGFQYSMLERSFNNVMQIATEDGLYTLADMNNPSSTIALTNAFTYNHTSEGLPMSTEHRMFMLQDQIDGMDYSNSFGVNLTCCIDYSDFHEEIYTAQSGTWTNGNGLNPFNATGPVDVKKELRIPAGVTVTISNMQFNFAPGARVVIENGINGQQGGRLILNNSLFTSDKRCNSANTWLGVEVWGNSGLVQGSINNSTQGRLIMSNSTIENALIGALISKRQVTSNPITNCAMDDVVQPTGFVDANNGGIVQTSNSHFLNNHRGVMFRPYVATNNMNNVSHFFRTNFHWTDDYLISNVGDQARLISVKGVNFKGCEFMNLISAGNNKHYQGFGIHATESQFYVTPYCPSITQFGQPCPNPIPSRFSNLSYGIRAFNFVNAAYTFTCSENVFSDNRYGIYVVGTRSERILRNDMAVRQTDTYQTAGIALYNSTGYFVQENELYALDNPLVTADQAETYGIVVNNSGEDVNEIYKNDFHELKIGGQTERVNATIVIYPSNDTIKGLQWKCNDFQFDIENHDLTLMSGRMNYHQGTASGGTSLLDAKRRAANNKFSLTSEASSLEHDIYLSDYSQHIMYSHLNAAQHIPDSYTFFNLSPSGVNQASIALSSAQWGGPITDDAGACPSKIVKKIPSISLPAIFQFRDAAEDLGDQIDGGNTTSLLDLIETGSNGQVKNGLMAASPYLSDEVLIRYIQSNPPHGHLKQVMVANSQLSEQVKAVLVNHVMPNGTANQIADAQVGISERTKLYTEINYLRGEADLEYNDLISQLLLDESDTLDVQVIIDVMEAVGDHERLRQLLSLYIGIDDTSRAEQTRVQLEAENACVYFMELKDIHREISCKKDPSEALQEDPNLVARLEDLRANSQDEMIALAADYLLNYFFGITDAPPFLTDDVNKSMFTQSEIKEKIDLHRNVAVNIYPNPTTGRVNFDYPDQSTGTMEITIISIDGKVMMEFSATETNGESVDVGHLQKGYYLVKITLDGEELETQKLEVF